MSTMMKIDTLKLADDLEAAQGDPRKTARVIGEAVASIDTSELATKSDIAALEGKIAALDGKIDSKTASLEGKIETRVAALEAAIYKQLWIMGAGIVGVTVTLIKLLP